MEAIQKFMQALAQDGIEIEAPIIGDEKLHRFHVGGDSNGTLNGWYVLYLEPFPYGVYGCRKRYPHETLNWSAKAESEMSQEEKSNYRATVLVAKEKLAQMKSGLPLKAQDVAKKQLTINRLENSLYRPSGESGILWVCCNLS